MLALSPRNERRRQRHRQTFEEQKGAKKSKVGEVIVARIGADSHVGGLVRCC